MIPFQKIMWPTDLDNPSMEALDAACALAAHFSSNLFVFHAIERLSPSGQLEDFRPMAGVGSTAMQAERAKKRVKQDMMNVFKRAIRNRVPSAFGVFPIVTYGKAAEEIVRLADRENIDLIVMANKRKSGFWRFMSKSVTDDVLRRAPCPVLTVKTQG